MDVWDASIPQMSCDRTEYGSTSAMKTSLPEDRQRGRAAVPQSVASIIARELNAEAAHLTRLALRPRRRADLLRRGRDAGRPDHRRTVSQLTRSPTPLSHCARGA